MKLIDPTDFEILGAFKTHGRNVASNVALHLDRDRPYINTRLPVLADFGLLRYVGPAEQSGLYELTDRGRAALVNRDKYGDEAFEQIVEENTPS